MTILKRGSTGAAVRALQGILDLDIDGVFGGGTEEAVMAHQREEGLAADGIVDADTLATLGLWDLITLQEGARGETVAKVQAALGIEGDGHFGSDTRRAVMAFQTAHGLVADGVVGSATLHHLDVMD